MAWYDHLKSYVWDDRTTPYLVPVARLTQPQARKELFTYCAFVTGVYGAGSLAALLQARMQSNPLYYLAALYCVSVVAAIIHLGYTKQASAARYAASAPLLALLAFATGIINPRLHTVEALGLGAICLIWLRYSFRVIAIAQAYHRMPERLPPGTPKPTNPRQRGE